MAIANYTPPEPEPVKGTVNLELTVAEAEALYKILGVIHGNTSAVWDIYTALGHIREVENSDEFVIKYRESDNKPGLWNRKRNG